MRYLLILLTITILSTTTTAQLVGDTENGLASYYSKEYHGAETAYGVTYDKNDLVAAHRQFPQNSVVSVKNLENNKTVQVRIIDKGPFIRGRIIELSERAAVRLDMIGKETVPVEITLLSTPDQPAVASTPARRTPVVVPEPEPEPAPRTAERRPTAPVTTPAPAAAPPSTTPTVRPRTVSPQPTPPPTVTPAAATVKATPVAKKEFVRDQATFAPGTYKIELLAKPTGNFGVQVGSFKDLEGAMDKIAELQNKWFENILLTRVNTGDASVYKIILGPFAEQDSATRYASDLKKRYKMDGFTVVLE
ncbi:MAG: septal ring lytic transglycosylase RlpA family protein [Bacteroidota bacterium]